MRFGSTVLLLALAGCGATPLQRPPEDALQPCQEPVQTVKTNGDLVLYVNKLRGALRACAAQVEAIIDWAQ